MPTTDPESYQSPGVLPGASNSEALGADETWTGEWVSVSYFSSVIVSVATDQSGTLQVQFSPDKTNVDSTLSFQVLAGVPESPHRLSVARKWMRINYVNGSTAQTYFRLQSLAGFQPILSSPKNLVLGQDSDAIATRGTAFDQEVVEGQRQGYDVRNKFGRNSDIDTAVLPVDIWRGGERAYGSIYTGFPIKVAYETLEVLSTSANDTAAGSGARTVKLVGLDGEPGDNFGKRITETVTLNGTTPVETTNKFYRCTRAIVMTSGADNQNFNDGDLIGRGSVTNADVFFRMPLGTNQTQIACDTVPAGRTGYLKNIDVEMSRANTGTAIGALWVREYEASPRLIRQFSVSNGSSLSKEIYGGLVLPALTDVAVRITSVSNNSTDIQAYFDFLLVDD